jgi:hypothetical protein
MEYRGLFNNGQLYPLSAYPAWLTDFGIYPINLLQATSPPVGTYTITFTKGGSPPTLDATLIIEVVPSLADSLTTCNKEGSICLVWITREGGRASYIFDQRKDTGGTLGESQTFDNSGKLKWLNRGKNYINKSIFKTGLSRNEVDLIESLRYSIQSWEYDLSTDTSTEIIITPENYNKYTTKDKLTEINIKYRIAEYKEVQNQ